MIRIGVIERIQLINTLQRIEIHSKTGLLTAGHNEQVVELYFQQGRLTSIGLKEHISLGKRLVQAGVISQDQLRGALLTLGATGSNSLAPENHSEIQMALTLIELELVSREWLDAWIIQEAVEMLHDLLAWPESEIYFDEGVQTPIDRFPLDYHITSLISSHRNSASTSLLSFTECRTVIEKPSLPIIPVTPLLFKKAQLGIKDTPVPITPATPLPALFNTSTPGKPRFSLPITPPPTHYNTPFEKILTLPLKVLKRDPQLEKLNTFSMAALHSITHPKEMKNLKIRISGAIFVVASIFYISWLLHALNTNALWLSLPFLIATLYITIFILITIYNNWNRSVPKLFRLPDALEPTVAVLLPTYGEPVDMVQRTIESVLEQDWPHEALVIIIGDDGHKPQVQYMVENMQRKYPAAQIIYHQPPVKNSPLRMGKAKDGNLNSMLKLISAHYPNIQYIETRDADDIVGDANFLRYTIGHLVSNPKAAFVQTIKEAMVSPGDPFGNMQSSFYRGLMLSKHATNSVFPCGSGLVWRKQHLDKIGGLPTWNLVEDLYSGYVAMQHGFIGSYLPIVGAIGQVAPEDIPNVYKQLGTWALDTIRLFVWKNPWLVKGLTFKQRMHFTEMGIFYLSSFIQLIFFLTPAICLFSGDHPFVVNNPLVFIVLVGTYAFIIDLFVLFLGHDVTFKETWRAKQLCLGMMFVYIKASFLAILYGPNKKPVYKVTRKVQKIGFYFKETIFQTLLFVLLLISIIYNYTLHKGIVKDIDFGSVIWALLYMFILSGIISKSWYGLELTQLASIRKRKPKL